MNYTIKFLLIISMFSCAKVPQQSVELSATVGRDIVQVYTAHKTTSQLLFKRMKDDVNKFVDEVYAPYQISKLLKSDMADYLNNDSSSLFFALNSSTNSDNDPEKHKQVLEMMKTFIEIINEDVESYREELLLPINEQEKQVLSAIDRSYNQIIYANSIVTGHLSSIRKVKDAQEEILNQFGLDGIQEKTSSKLAEFSSKVSSTLNKARKIDLDEIENQLKEVRSSMDAIFK